VRKSIAALGLAALAGTGIGLWAAPEASAQPNARAYIDDPAHTIYYTAGHGQTNDVTITTGADYTEFIIDDVVPIEYDADEPGCTRVDPDDRTKVKCTLTDYGDYYPVIIVTLGDRDDAIDATGSEAADDLYGGAGNDTMTGGRMWGEDGDDTLTGGSTMSGGYGHDTITGTDGDNDIEGGTGHDIILAGDGADTVHGNSGEDDLRGGPGNDELYGGPDDDLVYGNSGDDLLHGGPDTDQLSGGPGTDEVHQD
jgi:Ca2+-binding RTX toxin-like protein